MNNLENLSKRVFLLSILGIVVSAYLIYHHENIVGGYNIGQSFCNVSKSFNCDDVTRSKYSSIGGFSVACLGLVYFIFVALTYFHKNKRIEVALAYVGLASLLALIPSLFLLFISIFVIKKFCLFCILLDLIVLCIVFLSLKFVKTVNLKQLSVFISDFKIHLFCILPLGLVFSFSLPWLFRNFILEAALKEAAIGKIYQEWESSPVVNLNLDMGTDLMLKDFSIGPDNAKVVFVEFSDFECPFCQLASMQVKSIAKRWPNDLKIIFKNFPLDTMCNEKFDQAPHQLACHAAVMARCAGMKGEASFWDFHDKLFSLDHEDWSLENLLKLSGTEAEQINECVNKGLALERVKADSELGNTIGIDSTPSFFINGRRAKVTRLDQLDKLVERILKNPK